MVIGSMLRDIENGYPHLNDRERRYMGYRMLAHRFAGYEDVCVNGIPGRFKPSPFNCKEYHEQFPLLVLAGMQKSPDCNVQHIDFFQRQLRNACGQHGAPDRKVLVLGLATPAMAELVYNTVPESPIVVVDVCATPLMETEAVFQRKEAKIEFRQANAEQLPFDSGTIAGIATDSFITRQGKLKKVLDEIFRVMVKDGIFATTWKRENPASFQYEDPKLTAYKFTETAVDDLTRGGIPFDFGDVASIHSYALKHISTKGGNTEDEIRQIMGQSFPHVLVDTLGYPVFSTIGRHYAVVTARKS